MARTTAGFYFVGTIDGSPPAKRMCDVKGGTVYYEGQVLRQSATSGSLARAAAGGTSIFGVSGAAISADATTTQMPVYLADDKNLFEVKMPASVTPATRRGLKVALQSVGTIHNYRIEGTARQGNGTAVCRIVDFHPDDSAAGTNKRFWVTFIDANSVAGGDADSQY